jgi:RNA polymerase sigma-70 factor (ECF subfamily)
MTADITGLLIAWSRGDEAALDGLMSAMYPELRRIARIHLSRRQRGHTLESVWDGSGLWVWTLTS